jgi:competence protein ComEC
MNKRRVIILGVFFLAVAAIWSAVLWEMPHKGVLKVAFLDIGQGDAIFIEAPNGTQMLIDGGPNKGVLRQLGSVMSFWDRSIDIVAMSHPDLDHIGGLPSVMERFYVTYFMMPGVDGASGAYQTLLDDVKAEPAQTILARKGIVWLDKEDGVYLDVLFPDRDVSGFETNTASIVAKLVYGDTSFLLTGDSPLAIEKYLASQYGQGLNVDVLKLGHHGSRTSSSEEFLGYTSPAYAVISAGKDNMYGHPHKEVLDLLKKHAIPFLYTADEGTILFESDGVSVTHKK